MKKVIFTQDWMAMHPYEKPNEVDQYYTELANEIYHALDEACFTHQFKNVEDAKQLALSIAGYFEDVISGAGIWKTFTAECKKRYGSYIPFYENEDDFVPNTLNEDVPEYDPEEINFADIKFLCWHHYQQSTYIQEAVPFLFSTMTLAAKLAYNLLDKEYETAPENERLITYLSEMPVLESQNEEEEKQLDEIHRRDTLAWFHYGCYFNVGNRQRLQFALQQMANSPQGLTEPMAYSIQMEMTIASRSNLLALTSLEWLEKITTEMPTHKLWEDEEFRKKATEQYEKVDIRFPQKYEKGIILSGSPYTGINISFGFAHCIASPENPYYNAERAEDDSFGIISGNGRPFPYEIVCKLIDNNMLPDANIFTSRYVKEEGLKITQANLQFLADYYLMGRKDKDLSPAELW